MIENIKYKFPPGFKSLRNGAADDPHEYTDTSRTDEYYMSRTDKDKSIENLKSMNNKNSDDEYKEENFQHQTAMKISSTKPNKKKH